MKLQCNVIFHCITSCTLEHFYVECSSMFSLVCYDFYLLFTIFFSEVADNKHSQLVEIPKERSIFECNIKKSVPKSLQLKNYCVTFKNRNVQLRFEISITDTSRDQLMTSNKLPAFRVELMIFTRLLFKLVFRVSGRVCHEIYL